jgi:hypothetical protein
VKSGPHGSIDIIDLDGFNPFKQVFVNHKGDSLFRKKIIIVPRFIQNQAQRWPRSATLIKCDPNGWDGDLILQGVFDHLTGLSRNFKHETLL